MRFYDVVVIRGCQTDGGQSRGFLQAIPSPMSGGLVIAEGTLESPAIIGCMGRFPAKSATVSFNQRLLSPVDFLLDNDVSWVIFVRREVDNSSPGIS